MLEVLQISENGLRANQSWISSISHNVANMQTPGFKKTSLSFGELVSLPQPDSGVGKTTFSGQGVVVNSQDTDFRQGDMKMTSRPLDLAIDGAGFFEVELPDGKYGYTRVGRLSVDVEGRLVTQDGHSLSGEISVPLDSKNLRVDLDGTVSVSIVQDEVLEIGKIQIVNFANPEGLRSIGNEFYEATEKSGEAEQIVDVNSHKLRQGFLELSNVDLIDEMSDLLLAQRAYQLNARLIQTADQILETINNLRR